MAIKSDDVIPLDQIPARCELATFQLLEEAVHGLDDVRNGRVATPGQVLAKYKPKRPR